MSLDEQIWRFLVDDVALDVCFEIHRELVVDGMSLEELHDVEPIERPVDRPVVQQDSVFLSCTYCKRQVYAARYTNHLEKCITGARRQVTQTNGTGREKQPTLSKPPLFGASGS